ncbi:MAG: hypothetical protein L3J95_00280 [Thermoplasmata archaeon]|nr:hypothetical protein [Thermoplasmata archaeon]MCI4358857.1 hypothetical protein [Thermoplasmata archaeon]
MDDIPVSTPAVVPAVFLPSSPRYGYLVARLRNRQITMEEATELFGLMQDSLATAAQAVRQATLPPPPRGGGRTMAPPPPGGTPITIPMRDEDVALGLLALGAGAGLLAAILKRSAEGPRALGPK